MKILVLNGMTGDESLQPFTQAIESTIMENDKHQIEYFRLKDMNINYCTGCWSCWYKTPGYCAIKDDHEQILSRMPHSDLVLYISPIINGYESAILKTCKDRSIPNTHPYIQVYKGEQHHYRRYEHMPDLAVMMIKDDLTSQEDIDLIRYSFDRMALNGQSEVKSFAVIDEVGGVANVINNL